MNKEDNCKCSLDGLIKLQEVIDKLQQENKQLKERIEYLERSNNRREDTIIKDRQEISDLEDNWNKLKEEIQRLLNRQYDIDKFAEEQGFATYNPVRLTIEHIRNKMQELEKGDNNE